MSRDALHSILEHVRGEPSRTWSIIITVYGDAVVPRGGSVWLGTLLAFFKGLDIAEGVVRTAMSRLAADGWLERTRIGRNSFYRLAEKGRETFRQATAHIYELRPPAWSGAFRMFLPDLAAGREEMRTTLEAAGFGMPAPGVWIAPSGVPRPEAAHGLDFELKGTPGAVRALAARAWQLDETGTAYARFIEAFAPLAEALDGGARLSDLEAMVARVLLIHEYRRIVLRDPVLPEEILPEGWPGTAARAVCARIYGHVLAPSERWLDAHTLGEDGAPLPANPDVRRRFRD